LVNSLTDEQCVEVLRHKSVVEKIYDNIKSRLKQLSPERLEEIGIKLQAGANKTSITDQGKAREILLGIFPEDDLDSITKIGMGDLYTLYRKHVGCTEKLAKQGIEKLLSPVTTRTTNAGSLKIIK